MAKAYPLGKISIGCMGDGFEVEVRVEPFAMFEYVPTYGGTIDIVYGGIRNMEYELRFRFESAEKMLQFGIILRHIANMLAEEENSETSDFWRGLAETTFDAVAKASSVEPAKIQLDERTQEIFTETQGITLDAFRGKTG